MNNREKKYLFETISRRKTAVVRLRPSRDNKTSITVNDKPFERYFPVAAWRELALAPLKKTGFKERYSWSAKISGGGLSAQAGALRQALACALVKIDGNLKPILKKNKFLTRDAREKERRKFGLKKARKAPQWSKR